MKGTNHVSNLMWQFWCMMSSCFMNVQTLGLRTENNNNNAVPKEGELKEEASTVQTRAFLSSEWNTKPGYTGKKVRETGGSTWLGSISPLPSSENTFFVERIHLRWAFFIPPPFESNLLVREVLPGAPVGIKHPTLTHRLPHKIKALPRSFHWKDRNEMDAALRGARPSPHENVFIPWTQNHLFLVHWSIYSNGHVTYFNLHD